MKSFFACLLLITSLSSHAQSLDSDGPSNSALPDNVREIILTERDPDTPIRKGDRLDCKIEYFTERTEGTTLFDSWTVLRFHVRGYRLTGIKPVCQWEYEGETSYVCRKPTAEELKTTRRDRLASEVFSQSPRAVEKRPKLKKLQRMVNRLIEHSRQYCDQVRVFEKQD